MTALFVDALLENSPTKPKSRALEWTLSLAAHGILMAATLLVPLYWIDRIEVHPSNYTQLVATTAELGSNLSSAHLPSPAEARLEAPRDAGGTMKAPQLISMVEPVYPPLMRRLKVQGDVVIDAVIDTKGNVVEEHIVSGNEFLVAAAMDAVRLWKYQPAVLDGQMYPVQLRVTIAFRLGKTVG